MIAYVLNHKDLSVKDVLEFEQYTFMFDLDLDDKSTIVVARKPNIENKDIVICKDGTRTVFQGICTDYNSRNDNIDYNIKLSQIEHIFSQDVFTMSEEIHRNIGMEDFVKWSIEHFFSDTGDPPMDMDYVTVNVLTHTTVYALISSFVTTENGVYNFKTFLGNIRQEYGIFTDFVFDTGEHTLTINVYHLDEPILNIDIENTDISDYQETYNVDTMTRLWVHWKIPDIEDEQGRKIVGAESYREYFLRTNRTITDDKDDPDRAVGVTKCVYIEAEDEADMRQQSYNQFTGNRYTHKVSFMLRKDSRLYPLTEYYCGRQCRIKTKSGIRESVITAVSYGTNSAMANVTFGKLPVTLLEKLRSMNR